MLAPAVFNGARNLRLENCTLHWCSAGTWSVRNDRQLARHWPRDISGRICQALVHNVISSVQRPVSHSHPTTNVLRRMNQNRLQASLHKQYLSLCALTYGAMQAEVE